MLPAEKKHYRKGLALGLTLAETFSIIVFILILASAFLLRQEQNQREVAQEQRDTARADLRIGQEMLRADSMSWANADAWFDYSRQLREEMDAQSARADVAEAELERERQRASEAAELLAERGMDPEATERIMEQAAELAALEDSISQSERQFREASVRADSLELRLNEAEQIVEHVERQIGEQTELDREIARELVAQAARSPTLADSLSNARNAINALDSELQRIQQLQSGNAADSLRKVLEESRFRGDTLLSRVRAAEQQRDDAVGRAEFREQQIEQMRQGIGIDPPPCWLDDAGDPEYIFRIELLDAGMRLFNIAPPLRTEGDVEIATRAAAIEEGRVYSPAEFLALTLPFYTTGVSRTQSFGPAGCRFWIQPIDRTGDRKEVFRERESQLWTRFWFRWP